MTRLEEINPEAIRPLAKSLKGNALFVALVSERADELREAWETTDEADRDGREAIYVELRALRNVRDYFDARLADLAGDGDQRQ